MNSSMHNFFSGTNSVAGNNWDGNRNMHHSQYWNLQNHQLQNPGFVVPTGYSNSNYNHNQAEFRHRTFSHVAPSQPTQIQYVQNVSRNQYGRDMQSNQRYPPQQVEQQNLGYAQQFLSDATTQNQGVLNSYDPAPSHPAQIQYVQNVPRNPYGRDMQSNQRYPPQQFEQQNLGYAQRLLPEATIQNQGVLNLYDPTYSAPLHANQIANLSVPSYHTQALHVSQPSQIQQIAGYQAPQNNPLDYSNQHVQYNHVNNRTLFSNHLNVQQVHTQELSGFQMPQNNSFNHSNQKFHNNRPSSSYVYDQQVQTQQIPVSANSHAPSEMAHRISAHHPASESQQLGSTSENERLVEISAEDDEKAREVIDQLYSNRYVNSRNKTPEEGRNFSYHRLTKTETKYLKSLYEENKSRKDYKAIAVKMGLPAFKVEKRFTKMRENDRKENKGGEEELGAPIINY